MGILSERADSAVKKRSEALRLPGFGYGGVNLSPSVEPRPEGPYARNSFCGGSR